MKKIPYNFIVIGIFVISVSSSEHSAQSVNYINWNNVNDLKCTENQYRCKNGECVPADIVCDGVEDCDDLSDELYAACRNIRCPKYLFRCSYGACVDKDSKCNGIKDCADNSDELHKDCPGHVKTVRRCFGSDYQCDDGGCILSDQVCDGVPNCGDGSDETIKQCSEFHCPQFAFRCAYGGCVDGESPCNGIIECADGSDETIEMCTSYNKTHHTNIANGCVIPPFKGRLYNSLGFEIKVRAGDRIEPYKQIEFVCNDDERIYSVCEDGKWSRSLNCSKSCNRIVPDSDVDIVCRHKSGQRINCAQSMVNASTISAKCKNNPDKNAFIITCINGEWSSELPNCNKKKAMIDIVYDDAITITITDADNLPSQKSDKVIIISNHSKAKIVLQDRRNN